MRRQMIQDPATDLGNDMLAADSPPLHQVEAELGDLLDDLTVRVDMPRKLVSLHPDRPHDLFFAGEVVDQLGIQARQRFTDHSTPIDRMTCSSLVKWSISWAFKRDSDSPTTPPR